MADEPKAPSAFETVQAWIVKAGDEVPRLSYPEVAKRLLAQFKGTDLWAELVADTEYALAYNLVQDTFARTRVVGLLRNDESVPVRVANGDPANKVSPAEKKWWAWREHVGNQSVLVPEMMHGDLKEASVERANRAQPEIELAELWLRLSVRISGDQRVRDRWKPEEIEQLHRQIREEYTSGNLRIDSRRFFNLSRGNSVPQPRPGREARRPRSPRSLDPVKRRDDQGVGNPVANVPASV